MAMGSRFAPVFENMFMKRFEKKNFGDNFTKTNEMVPDTQIAR